MSARKPQVGDRVLWADLEYTVWSLHPKRGYVWLTRDGKTVAARIANTTLLEAAGQPDRPKPATVAKPRTPLASTDRKAIEDAIRAVAAAHDGVVDPNLVRAALHDHRAAIAGDKVRSTAFARLLSATYSALAAEGRLESLGYVGTNDDAAGGNAGKPQRHWRWVA